METFLELFDNLLGVDLRLFNVDDVRETETSELGGLVAEINREVGAGRSSTCTTTLHVAFGHLEHATFIEF